MSKVTLFDQIIARIDSSNLKSLVRKKQTHQRQKGFSSRAHIAAMLFAPFASCQIWSTLITILLPRTFKKEAHHKWNLSNLIAHIRLNLFVKMDLMTSLNNPFAKAAHLPDKYTQGVLF